MNRAILLLLFLAGCTQAVRQSGNELTTPIWFRSPQNHMRFAYPASWHPVKDDTIATLVPMGASSIGIRTLVIDRPDLPPHLPGLIPLGLVEHGFVADLKTRYKQVSVDASADQLVAGAVGRRIEATGMAEQGRRVVTVVLFVHGDAVYIIDAETDPDVAPQAHEALKMIVDSIQWMD